MLASWTNFAKAGSPNPPTSAGEESGDSGGEDELSWPVFTPEGRECLLLQSEPEVRADPYPERMLLWRRFVWDSSIHAAETERLKAERVVVGNTNTPILTTWLAPGSPYYVPVLYPWRTTYPTLPFFPTTIG
jgi:hypothetical protein